MSSRSKIHRDCRMLHAGAGNPRADYQSFDTGAAVTIVGRRHHLVYAKNAVRTAQHAISRAASHAHLRAAAERSGDGFFRQALSRCHAVTPRSITIFWSTAPVTWCKPRHSDQRRPCRCPVTDCASRKFAIPRPRSWSARMRKLDSAPDVRHRRAGGHRFAYHRAGNGKGSCAKTYWPNATAAISRARRKLLEKQKAGKKTHEAGG